MASTGEPWGNWRWGPLVARLGRETVAGVGLCVLVAAALWLPWWQSPRPVVVSGHGVTVDRSSGGDVVGSGRSVAVVVAVLAAAAAAVAVAVAAARFGRADKGVALTRVLVGASGAAGAATAGAYLARWGWGNGAGWGAVVTLTAGLGAVAVAVRGVFQATGRARQVSLAGVAPGLLVLLVPASDLDARQPELTSGPYLKLADLRDGESQYWPVRPASRGDFDLTVFDGQAALTAGRELIAVGADGGAEVVALRPLDETTHVVEDGPPEGDSGHILGVAGDRVVRRGGFYSGSLVVWSETSDDPFEMWVHGVQWASRVGTDGSVWLEASDDEFATLRRFDVAAARDGQDVEARDLPVVKIAAPDGTNPQASLGPVLPVEGGALTVYGRPAYQPEAYRLARLGTATAGEGPVTEVLAGGLDPACGLTSDGLSSYFRYGASEPTPDGAGGLWFVVSRDADWTGATEVVHLDAGGTLRRLAPPAPGNVYAITLDGSGALVLAVSTATKSSELWRLPDAAAHLADLPPPPAGCGAP